MNHRPRICFAAQLLSALLLVGCSTGSARVEKTSYRDWPDAYRLHNEEAELIVVPSIGRVMSYAPRGGENVLWNDPTLGHAHSSTRPSEWFNFGGDKTWHWPQDDWPDMIGHDWPPPPDLNRPQSASVVDGPTLRLIGPTIQAVGARIERDITLAPAGTRVTIVTRLRRVGESKRPIAAWNVTQIHTPPFVIVRTFGHANTPNDLAYRQMFNNHWRPIWSEGRLLAFAPPPDRDDKIGIDGDLLAAVHNDVLFVQWDANSDGAKTGDRAQIYTQKPEPEKLARGVMPYAEMELTSVRKKLAVDEAVELTVCWELIPVRRGITPTDAAKIVTDRWRMLP